MTKNGKQYIFRPSSTTPTEVNEWLANQTDPVKGVSFPKLLESLVLSRIGEPEKDDSSSIQQNIETTFDWDKMESLVKKTVAESLETYIPNVLEDLSNPGLSESEVLDHLGSIEKSIIAVLDKLDSVVVSTSNTVDVVEVPEEPAYDIVVEEISDDEAALLSDFLFDGTMDIFDQDNESNHEGVSHYVSCDCVSTNEPEPDLEAENHLKFDLGSDDDFDTDLAIELFDSPHEQSSEDFDSTKKVKYGDGFFDILDEILM